MSDVKKMTGAELVSRFESSICDDYPGADLQVIENYRAELLRRLAPSPAEGTEPGEPL